MPVSVPIICHCFNALEKWICMETFRTFRTSGDAVEPTTALDVINTRDSVAQFADFDQTVVR
jgi:hypothetical protein